MRQTAHLRVSATRARDFAWLTQALCDKGYIPPSDLRWRARSLRTAAAGPPGGAKQCWLVAEYFLLPGGGPTKKSQETPDKARQAPLTNFFFKCTPTEHRASDASQCLTSAHKSVPGKKILPTERGPAAGTCPRPRALFTGNHTGGFDEAELAEACERSVLDVRNECTKGVPECSTSTLPAIYATGPLYASKRYL